MYNLGVRGKQLVKFLSYRTTKICDYLLRNVAKQINGFTDVVSKLIRTYRFRDIFQNISIFQSEKETKKCVEFGYKPRLK